MTGKWCVFLVIVVVMGAGCSIPLQKDQPAETPALFSARISPSPAGAGVYLDNLYRGTTPVTVPGLLPGTHHPELRLRDHQPWSQSIEIEEGTNLSLDTVLVPVDITTAATTMQTTWATVLPTTRPRPATAPATPVTTPAYAGSAGTWHGSTKDAPSGSPVPFTMQLNQQHKSVWGTIGEHEDLMHYTGTHRVSGNVDGNHVMLNVYHNTTHGVAITIWNGDYDPALQKITGRWYVGISQGSFVMTRA